MLLEWVNLKSTWHVYLASEKFYKMPDTDPFTGQTISHYAKVDRSRALKAAYYLLHQAVPLVLLAPEDFAHNDDYAGVL